MTDIATKQDSEPEIDEELLVEAQRQISAPFRNSAINEALRRLVEEERGKRREAMEQLRRLNDEGAFDYDALDAADQ